MLQSFQAKKYRKLSAGAGAIAICGLILYERYKINKLLSNIVNTNVVEIDKKRPNYIYIKYHIYRESTRKMKEKEQDKNLINVIIHPVGKWWKTFKHSVAWRLLNIAQTGDQHARTKAVRQLARIDHLKDWDFRHLAQICDARTAVSLARSDCDNRWFVPVHKNGIVKNPKMVLSDIKNTLNGLLPSKCVDHFMKKFWNAELDKDCDIDEYYAHAVPISRQDVDLLKESIAFFHHVTKDVRICEKFLDSGGLMTLMELRKYFAKDNETLTTLCKTLANLSLANNSLEHFFVSGWVAVLAQWQQHPDVRLQVISSKVLTNLDHDDQFHSAYPANVYPLYPRNRTLTAPTLDIVFIHGLLGGVFITWRQKDRENNELGLYGKNAFYTSESDDIFLVGEPKRGTVKSGNGNGGSKDALKSKTVESFTPADLPLINKTRKVTNKASGISDMATKELVETLEMSAELDPEWDVVFPDCPLNSSCPPQNEGPYSVSGDKWINDDDNEEYTNCWPMDWLPEDYPNIRVIGIDYTSAVTQWSANYAKYCPCEKGHGYVDNRAKYLLGHLHAAGVGVNRPVIWVGHSMGGIICKHILLNAIDSPNPEVQKLATNTRGMIFLGTPHKGSSIARWRQHMQMILSPSIEVRELEENSPKLLEVHNRFMRCLKTCLKHIKVVSIAEGAPTMLTSFKFPLRIVTEESAFIDHGDFYVLKDDHLSLSKPIFRQSFLYQKILNVIGSAMKAPLDSESSDHNDVHSKYSSKSFKFWSLFPNILFKFLTPFET